MILFSHLCEESGLWHDDLIFSRWSLRFLDVKLVLTLPMYFNIWLRLVKVSMVIPNVYLNMTLLLMIYVPFVDVCMMCCFKKGVFK